MVPLLILTILATKLPCINRLGGLLACREERPEFPPAHDIANEAYPWASGFDGATFQKDSPF